MVSERSSHVLATQVGRPAPGRAVLLHVPDDPRRSAFNLFIFLCICLPLGREEEWETHSSLCLCQPDRAKRQHHFLTVGRRQKRPVPLPRSRWEGKTREEQGGSKYLPFPGKGISAQKTPKSTSRRETHTGELTGYRVDTQRQHISAQHQQGGGHCFN